MVVDRQTYGAKYLTDANLSLDLGKVGMLKVGANNLFDVKPDKNKISSQEAVRYMITTDPL